MDKLWEALGAVIAGVILHSPIKKWIEKINIKRFRQSVEMTTEVNSIILEIRSIYGFNRVSIIDYHNGTTSFGGFSFKCATMTFESADTSTRPLISEFRNVPCSIISTMLVNLEKSETGYFLFDATSDKRSESAVTHKMFGVKKAYNFRIGPSLIHGCLSCVVTENSKHDVVLSDQDLLYIRAQCQKILLLRAKKSIFNK